jgi:hypothetical protein
MEKIEDLTKEIGDHEVFGKEELNSSLVETRF